MAVQVLADVAAGNGDAAGLIVAGGGAVLSRGALQTHVTQFGQKLAAAGIKPGDTVSNALTNTVEFVVSFLGVTSARAVSAPLNANYKEDEFQFYMEDSGASLLIVPPAGNEAAERAASTLNIPVIVFDMPADANGNLVQEVTVKSGTFNMPAEVPEGAPKPDPQPSDIGLFLHTSGTTSKPKGVPLTQANLCASLANIAATYELNETDRSYLVMPLFHVHGLMAGLLAPLSAGGSVILPGAGGKFSAGTFWSDIFEHKATYYTAVPTIHQILLARADKDYPKDKPSPLRFIRSCSSSLAGPTLHRLEDAFGVPVLEAYAMTEASHQMTSNPLPKHGPHKPGSVGTQQGTVKVAILDDENRQLPAGEIGEVCIQGPNVTKGYHNRPEANEVAFAGGWFHTGDQGKLDEEGYLTLTGRIKELINRGGEKISPLEVDAVLLGHASVAEAVCFGAPDEKYGEVVAAAVVLREGAEGGEGTEKDIMKFASAKLASFKVPGRIFITKELPKGPTGKIQRRFMAEAFIKPAGGGGSSGTTGETSSKGPATGGGVDAYSAIAHALFQLGVRQIFGVIGIPVTQLASAAQAKGIRYLGFRNEQAAGYAAAAAGFLTGRPGVLLTVSGPGALNGIAGLSHAQANCWPLLLISGSADQGEVGKGGFQECDQVSALKPHCKFTGKITAPGDINKVLAAAYGAAIKGRPGASYVDIPADVLMATGCDVKDDVKAEGPNHPTPSDSDLVAAADLLRSARKPLVVVGKGAAYSRAEGELLKLAERFNLPVLCTSMGRGLVPDGHPLCVNAARSLALGQADVALVVGARLNWQLHFGEPPKWAEGVKFVLLDVEPSERDAGLAKVVLRGDAAAVLGRLADKLTAEPALDPALHKDWLKELSGKASSASLKLKEKLSATSHPLDYSTVLRVVRHALDAVHPPPIVAAEGANTMDNARLILAAHEPRTRLDAGTWGTMGVGLGYAIAAAVTQPDRLVVAVEGDSAFGFSGMEVETIARYKLPVVVLVFNNNGVYGGDRRPEQLAAAAKEGARRGGFPEDPCPTDFVPGARYNLMMEAFGGRGYQVETCEQLQKAVTEAFAARAPALINIILDPMAGVESGNVHAFNAPKSK